MDFMKYFRTAAFRCLTGCLIIASLLSTPVYAVNSDDSQVFIAGFNAYQKKDYQTAIERMKTVLEKYPDTPLRDMAIFWLARANFKAGFERDAARYMSQFMKEYPDSPLKGTVEDELLGLVARFDKGEQLPVTAKRPASATVAAAPAPERKALAEKTAAAKQAAEQAARTVSEAERLAAEKAAAEKVAAERAAAEKAAAERVAAERMAAEKAAREKAEAERMALAKATAEKAAAERAAAEKAAAERAEAERLAAEKLAKEKAEAERLASEKAAKEKAEAERLALEKAAAEKAAAERAAVEKAAAERAAAERLAAEKFAREKAEAERLAAEKTAREKVEAERLAALKAADEKAAVERAAAETLAADRAAAERIAAEKAAREKSAAEQAAREKAEAEKRAAERLAAEKVAAEKAAAELRLAEQKAREKAEADRLAAEKATRERAAAEKLTAEKAEASKRATLREKAIGEYKSLIDRFPGTRAAATATAKLKDLGIVYPVPGTAAVASKPAPSEKNAQILSLEVGQFADADLTVAPVSQSLEVGKRHDIPFEVANRGNGTDSFYLESGFPAEFGAQFADAARKEIPVNMTPPIAPGERFNGVVSVTVPREYIDGQKMIYPIKIASRMDRDATQARDIMFAASAPLLRAVVKTDKGQILPGEKVAYRVTLLNIGTATAQGVSLRLNYPPQYEPVSPVGTGLKQEMKAALVLDAIRLASGESREFDVAFQLKDEAIAQQELFLRADVVNTELQTRDSFISASSFVKPVSGVAVRTNSDKLVVIPGQSIAVPLIVTNTGNVREDFLIKPQLPPNVTYTFYQDLNRDGIRQTNEPIINHVGPLAPKEESYVILDLSTPAAESDGTAATVSMAFEPESDKAKSVTANLRLVYARPVVELAMSGKGGRLKPGEVSSFELNFTNRGSSMAKAVELQSVLPEDLELVASDPSFGRAKNGDYIWKFDELGAGEKRVIKVTFRVKAGTAVGRSIQVKNVLNYQDQLGNRY
ncbi:pentapeptide repeat protein [Geobacter metallireducens GS-15]|uniref:Pentapeptide repeat protein n=2 Tax=Geobacter metallireducens TaxID=28232 RepID=Q39QN4_GEOMG|nr:pentapeptide repeat protein [Geobacter metallireducens GS-15]